MARLKGGLFTSTLDVTKRGPLDSREMVTKYEDLINPSIWKTNTSETEALYDGLCVSVSETGENMGKYFLVDRKAITEDNYNNYLQAKSNNEPTEQYFQMWQKILTVAKAEEKFDELVKLINGNTTEIKQLKTVTQEQSTAILAIQKQIDIGDKTISTYVEDILKTLPGLNTASSTILGLVKIDDTSIKMNDNNQLYVAKVSTDNIVQGEKTLILKGGDANTD